MTKWSLRDQSCILPPRKIQKGGRVRRSFGNPNNIKEKLLFFSPSTLETALSRQEQEKTFVKEWHCRDRHLLSSSLDSDVTKSCWKFTLCFLKDTSHWNFFTLYAMLFVKASNCLLRLLQPTFRARGRKSREQIDCEVFQREEIWKVILFQKRVIRKGHFTFTLFIVFWGAGVERETVLFSDLPGIESYLLLTLWLNRALHLSELWFLSRQWEACHHLRRLIVQIKHQVSAQRVTST